VERHVGFSGEYADEHDKDTESRLHRRDTPHHLKNKRINSSLSKEDAEAQVRLLLAKAKDNHNTQPPVSLANQQQVRFAVKLHDTEDSKKQLKV
jgi:protein scribble